MSTTPHPASLWWNFIKLVWPIFVSGLFFGIVGMWVLTITRPSPPPPVARVRVPAHLVWDARNMVLHVTYRARRDLLLCLSISETTEQCGLLTEWTADSVLPVDRVKEVDE